jgi:hypothetical protein
VGLAKDIYEAVSGKSLVSGETLSTAERVLAGVKIVTVGAASAFKSLKHIETLEALAHNPAVTNGGELLEAARVAQTAKEIGWDAKTLRDCADSAVSIERFGPMKQGPLHAIKEGEGTVADTFRSGSYMKVVTKEDVKLYRVHSSNRSPEGAYWSRTKPNGPFQATMDVALYPKFGNNASSWIEITVPPGATLYEGAASPVTLRTGRSNIPTGELYGGGSQVYLVDKKVLGRDAIEFESASGVFQ